MIKLYVEPSDLEPATGSVSVTSTVVVSVGGHAETCIHCHL